MSKELAKMHLEIMHALVVGKDSAESSEKETTTGRKRRKEEKDDGPAKVESRDQEE